jgi:hypothetical protein
MTFEQWFKLYGDYSLHVGRERGLAERAYAAGREDMRPLVERLMKCVQLVEAECVRMDDYGDTGARYEIFRKAAKKARAEADKFLGEK